MQRASDENAMAQMIPAWVGGVLTPVEKLEVHQRGLRHPAISVFLVRDGQVLLQQRALSKYHTPGLWANTCCTHPLWQEQSETCALRRLHEELGIEGVTLELRQTVEYRADVGQGLTEHEVVDIYIAYASGPVEVRLHPDEVMDTRWVPLAHLAQEIAAAPQDFTPWMQIYMAEHAETIFGAE
jgi:isopentenyl-diphosphate delta-isomerase